MNFILKGFISILKLAFIFSLLLTFCVCLMFLTDFCKTAKLKRKYNLDFFNDKTISFFHFASYSKLPEDKNLFQLVRNKSAYHTVFPKADYTEYNFKDVNIECSRFRKNSIINNKNTFQDIHNKSLFCVKLPKGDYSSFNFNGVLFCNTIFTKDSKLPRDINFFQKLERISVINASLLPRHVIKDIHLYNLDSINIDLSGCRLSKMQAFIIKTKYKGQCSNRHIALPDYKYLK